MTLFPIAHDSDSNITFNGTISPAGAGSVSLTYNVGGPRFPAGAVLHLRERRDSNPRPPA